jgi:ABC-type transporter Mla subunit MlaD
MSVGDCSAQLCRARSALHSYAATSTALDRTVNDLDRLILLLDTSRQQAEQEFCASEMHWVTAGG